MSVACVAQVLELIDQSREVLMKEPNVLQVQVGDTWQSTQGGSLLSKGVRCCLRRRKSTEDGSAEA